MTTPSRSFLTVERIGHDGDGLARAQDGTLVVVPFALPGDVIADGVLTDRSAAHQAPACGHFMTCGGCVAQHMREDVYRAWKRELVVEALRQHGVTAAVPELVAVPPGSRRRATFTAVKTAAGVRLGFHRRRDNAVLPLDACPIVSPRIENALPHLSHMVSRLGGVADDIRVAVADLDDGLDVQVTGATVALDAARRAALATAATAAGLVRLTIEDEIIIVRGTPLLTGTAGALRPEPGAFFQAVAVAERAIVAEVIKGLPKKTRQIADLFCGIGTLTLPLARHAQTIAFDSERTSLTSLDAALRHASGLKPVTTRYRDLLGEPLSRKELDAFDTVVLDPPRAGAKAQCETLARSAVETVIMVSCNPQTLARDLRLLVEGGYALVSVVPIDQFLWSAHVEAVAVLRRTRKQLPRSR